MRDSTRQVEGERVFQRVNEAAARLRDALRIASMTGHAAVLTTIAQALRLTEEAAEVLAHEFPDEEA